MKVLPYALLVIVSVVLLLCIKRIGDLNRQLGQHEAAIDMLKGAKGRSPGTKQVELSDAGSSGLLGSESYTEPDRAKRGIARPAQTEVGPADGRAGAPSERVSSADALRQKYARQYQPLAERLGLRASDAAGLIDLVIKRKSSEVDLVNQAFQNGKNPNGIEMQTEAAKFQRELEEGILRAFGQNALNEYRRHEWALSAENLVATASAMLRSTTPLTPTQGEQVKVALAGRFGANEGVGRPEDPVPYRIRIDDNVVTLLSGILHETQLKPFLVIKAAQDAQLRGALPNL